MSTSKKKTAPESTGKPKEPATRPLIDAGFGAGVQEEWQRRGLPFDPAAFAVDSGALAASLETVTSEGLLDRLQAFDTRTTAAAEYERRIHDLKATAQAGE